MLKIFKTVIKGNTGTETYERDNRHKITMGYDAETDSISVKVEEAIPPSPNLDEDLPEGTDTVLRDPHTTANLVVVAERTFTQADFAQKTDNYKWIVEYNATTKTISDPIDVYEISKQYVNGSNSHEKIYYNLNEYRYQFDANLTPLFIIDSFYKSLGFPKATVQFFVENFELDFLDTVLEVPAEQVTEVTPKEYEFWCNFNVRIAATFEIVDDAGKIITSAFPTVKPTSKAANFVPLEQRNSVDITGMNPALNLPQGTSISGSRFYAKMPAADAFNVRVLFGSKLHNLIGSRPSATFDVECVNCVANKTRLVSSYDPQNLNVYEQEFVANHNHPADKMQTSFDGVEGVLVQTAGLVSGDYFKLKLNLGEFVSWAELWVEIA